MAKCTYIDLLPEDYDLFYSNLASGDRFVNSRVKKKTTLFSRYKKGRLAAQSIFKTLSPVWRGFTDEQRQAWNDVGDVIELNGWQAFVEDTAARWRYSYSGYSTPSLLHNARVGKINISSPATEIKIAQYHPQFYYIRKKVYGKKGMYYPLKIEEYFGLPLELKIRYSSDLTAAGPSPFAKFYARVHSLYQGRDIYTDLEIDLDLSSAWKLDSAILSSVTGLAVNYDLYIHLQDVTGSLWFDNLEANHSGQNWVRDWDCDDINKVFGSVYYQVPQNWAPLIIPDGAEYESIYEEF